MFIMMYMYVRTCYNKCDFCIAKSRGAASNWEYKSLVFLSLIHLLRLESISKESNDTIRHASLCNCDGDCLSLSINVNIIRCKSEIDCEGLLLFISITGQDIQVDLSSARLKHTYIVVNTIIMFGVNQSKPGTYTNTEYKERLLRLSILHHQNISCWRNIVHLFSWVGSHNIPFHLMV